jgi:hypothetical protein
MENQVVRVVLCRLVAAADDLSVNDYNSNNGWWLEEIVEYCT